MDSSAFMAVPASSFSEPPPEEPLETEEVMLHPNGMVVNFEGERRRKEMLDNALALEKRYSYLLPPDRGRKFAHDTPSHTESHHEDESDTDRLSQVAGPSRKDASESYKFRLPIKSSASNTPAPSPAAVSAPKPNVGRKPKAIAAAAAPLTVATRALAIYKPIQTPAIYAAQHEHVAPVAVATPSVTAIANESRPSPSPTPPPESPAESPAATFVPVVVTSAVRGKKRGRGGRPPNVNLFGRQTKAKAAQPPPEPVMEPVAPTSEPNDDGESEKALSEDETQSKHPSPEPKLQPEPALPQAPVEEPVPVDLPQDEDVDMHEPEDEIQPDRYETTESSQLTIAPESDVPQAPLQDQEPSEPPVSEAATKEAANAPTVEEDSISVRPAKRPRKTRGTGTGRGPGRPPRQVSAAAVSEDLPISVVAPSASISAAAGPKVDKRPYAKSRGVVHYKSESGTEESTVSLLIIAAIKRESTKRGGEKRHNTSFGVPTPLFKEYDFELPESFFYPEGDVSRLPKVNDDEVVPIPQPGPGPDTDTESSANGTKPNGSADGNGEHVDGSEDLEETKEADEREGSEAADSEMTEPMDIDEPDPIKDVPTTRTSTTEPEEDELTEEIDIMPQPDDEPGVTPRELSFPIAGEDQDEILEW